MIFYSILPMSDNSESLFLPDWFHVNFSDKEIVEMSIYQVDENKKTLQVISDRARPFIKSFDFIKGFEDGRLEYESIISK